MASQSLTLPNLARKYNYTCIYRTPLTTYRKSKRVKGGGRNKEDHEGGRQRERREARVKKEGGRKKQ